MKKTFLLLLLVFIFSVFINFNIKAAELNYESELILTNYERFMVLMNVLN